MRSVLIPQIGSVSETNKPNLLISMKTFAVLVVADIDWMQFWIGWDEDIEFD